MDWVQIIGNGAVLALNSFLVFRMTKFIDKAELKLEHHEERIDVTDRVISMKTARPYDSSQVVKGHQRFPIWKDT